MTKCGVSGSILNAEVITGTMYEKSSSMRFSSNCSVETGEVLSITKAKIDRKLAREFPEAGKNISRHLSNT